MSSSQTFTSSGSWAAPGNLLPGSVRVYAIGEGGNSGTSASGAHSGGGGGGGACGGEPALGGVTGGVTTLTITIGTGGTSTDTTVTGGSVTVTGAHGGNGSGNNAGSGGAAGANTVAFKGGDGGVGIVAASRGGGGGGGSAGSTGAGGTGANGAGAGNAAGGTAGTGAAGPPSLAGAAGAQGGTPAQAGNNGIAPGSGAGGPGDSTSHAATTGAAGQVIIIWDVYTASFGGTGSGTGTVAAAKVASGSFGGTASGTGRNSNLPVINQWAGTFAQPAAFGTTPPALQSLVIALDSSTSVGGGSGTPTEGSWLFCLAGWNQGGLPAVTAGDADDIHSFWRPGDVETSTWAVSPSSGNTRCSIWYTANLARTAGDVYAAPSGAMAGMACTVVEVAGIGPWDTVTGIYGNYAAAATTLNLALAAPAAASFTIAAVCGNDDSASQAFTPAGWATLATVTATNGSDHTCDAVLTSAYLASSSGSLSVDGTAGSASDLSGVILSVQVDAASPLPGAANPGWPGRMILEVADGAGYQTPPDEMTWTTLSDNAWTSTAQGWKRFWSWADSTGVPYALGQLQSSSGSIQLDNWDGNMSPVSAAGATPWSFTASGTPGDGTYFTVTAGQAAGITAGDPFTDTANPGTLFKVTGTGAPSGGYVDVSFTPAAAAVMASPDVVTRLSPTTGNPVRLRMALGTLTDGTVVNRWYTWTRNALAWPERRNRALRGFVPLTTTDVWSVMSGSCPTPYRGEVEQDNPYAWWPFDDQPLAGGVQPTTFLNAAPGNTTTMDVIAAPGGVSAGHAYTTNGQDATAGTDGAVVPPSIATYAAAQQQGWMYGDPASSPQSAQTGNPVTANPGSAAWQQSGLAGNTGTNGWFLAANDPGFPALADGITVEGWFSPAFFGTATGWQNTGGSPGYYVLAGQPDSVITLATLSTGSAPVAILQLSPRPGT